MLCILAFNILDSKIVNSEYKCYVSSFFFPKSCGCWVWFVPVFGKALDKKVMCQYSGLWKAVNAFLYFHVYISISLHVMQLVLFDDCFGNIRKFDAYVLEAFHRSVKVKVLDIDGHEFGIRRGYGRVD